MKLGYPKHLALAILLAIAWTSCDHEEANPREDITRAFTTLDDDPSLQSIVSLYTIGIYLY